ncbi:MAG: hypothetical protein COB59_02975 [Rhodospirillaceae bacterium]|nr:MAG: hypothetical protein COB59_02975 [Rhodospirillaceae bacterium]
MTITIERIAPDHNGFTILGLTKQALQDVHVYFQTSEQGQQSANLRATSNQNGLWKATIPGTFKAGTKITAFARTGRAALACLTEVL